MLPLPMAYGMPAYATTAGLKNIPVKLLQKQLGPNAYLTWRKLQWCRDPAGITHVTFQSLQRFYTRDTKGRRAKWEEQTTAQVERGFKRLREAGLVVNVKWVRSKNRPKPLLRRAVFGALRNIETARVPMTAYPMIMRLSVHGGRRAGAGRPSGELGTVYAFRLGARIKVSHTVNLERTWRTESAKVESAERLLEFPGKRGEESVVHATLQDWSEGGVWYTSTEKSRRVTQALTNQVASIRANKSSGQHSNKYTFQSSDSDSREILKQVSKPELRSEEENSFSEEHRDGIGLRFGGPSSGRPSLDESRIFAEGVPRRPLATDVFAPKVPRPPEVLEELCDGDKVRLILQAYAAAYTEFTRTKADPYGKRWFGGPRDWRLDQVGTSHKSWERWKNYKSALNCANAMLEKGVRPVEWAHWRCSYLVGTSAGKFKFPFFNQIFSASQVQKRSGWFRNDKPTLGGRSIPGPVYKELMRRYGQMESTLRRSTGPVGLVVARYFPGDLFNELVAGAQEEAHERLEDFRHRVRQGEWVWR